MPRVEGHATSAIQPDSARATLTRMPTAPMPTVSFVYPGGGQVTMAVPGIPRVGDMVSARWGDSPAATLYAVNSVIWDLNQTRVLVHLAPAARA